MPEPISITAQSPCILAEFATPLDLVSAKPSSLTLAMSFAGMYTVALVLGGMVTVRVSLKPSRCQALAILP